MYLALNKMFRTARISYCTRWISSGDGGEGNKLKIFDRELKRKHRDRAAYLMQDNDYFPNKVADNLLDRLRDCKKTFPTALCLGGCLQPIRRLLAEQEGIEKLLMMDMSHDMIKRCKDSQQSTSDQKFETLYIVGDEEFIPIKESSLDLIISCLGLHWVNDLPSTMIQCRRILKPDGLFLAALLGGETLRELRIACTVAQMEREGGVSPRISPFVHVRDAGNLLTGAGFAIPAIDVDSFTIRYRNALELIDHLRCMGESNSLLNRIPTMKKETALASAAIYQSLFGKEDGTVPATFQVIYMTGWAPHPSQQKAKRRGSATVSFEDIQKAFGTEETV